MKYTTSSMTKETLHKELNDKYGDGDLNSMLDKADYSLIANTDDYKKYPQYYDFENVNNNHYVIEIRNSEVSNIYQVHEISDYEYSCHEIFWQTAHEWTNDVESVAQEVYLLD